MNEYLAWPIVGSALFLIAYFTVSLQLHFWTGRSKDDENPENNFWSGAFILFSLIGAAILTFTCVGMIAHWQGQWVYIAYAAIFTVAAFCVYRYFKKNLVGTSKEVTRRNLPISIQKLINFFEGILGIALVIGGMMAFIMSWATLSR
jgi:hypothetical protein